MNATPRPGQPLRSAGTAVICFGAASLAFLCTAGVAIYFAVISIAAIAQHHSTGQSAQAIQVDAQPEGAPPSSGQSAQVIDIASQPKGPLLLLAVGLATILLDVLLTWTGIRMLSGHPGARRLAGVSAVLGLFPAAGALALVLGVPGYETAWMIVVGIWFHSAIAILVAANFSRDPSWKQGPLERAPAPLTTGSATRSTR